MPVKPAVIKPLPQVVKKLANPNDKPALKLGKGARPAPMPFKKKSKKK